MNIYSHSEFVMFSKYILIGSAILVAVMGAALYYQQGKIDSLNKTVGQLEIANKQNVETIKTMQENQQKNLALLEDQRERIRVIYKETNKIKTILSEHDIGYLASKKPGLIERRVDDGTKDVIKSFEEATNPQKIIEEALGEKK